MGKTNNSLNDFKCRKRMLALSCSKKLSALLRGKTSKHDSNFYFFNCFHFLKTESKFKSHEKVCENKKSLWNCNAIAKG